jgi:transcriptional regulator with XRE-family HTH domain
MDTMFGQLGLTLQILRGLRGKSQAVLAQEAGIGKSQLSKYETGRELPKLESLARVLAALDVTPLAFFYVMDQLTQNGRWLSEGAPDPAEVELALAQRGAFLPRRTGRAIVRHFANMLELYRTLLGDGFGRGVREDGRD